MTTNSDYCLRCDGILSSDYVSCMRDGMMLCYNCDPDNKENYPRKPYSDLPSIDDLLAWMSEDEQADNISEAFSGGMLSPFEYYNGIANRWVDLGCPRK